tara:strand:- start:2111 stop:2782 length:672 start_codon:yes stop_codon:yes gene_type:complete
MKNTYSIYHFDFFDKIIVKKRIEILSIIKSLIDFKMISSCLDIGATNDIERKSSNFLIKNLKEIKILKSISIQEMDESFFNTSLNKSITNDFTNIEIEKMSSDLAISSATIEHVGNEKNQIKAIGNIIKLSKKYFVITTPNRFHPIDFHTLIPFIHWLPKKVHRFLLKIIGLNYFSKEENLNLLSKSDLEKMMRSFNDLVDYKIKTINLFGFVSNFIVIGKKK